MSKAVQFIGENVSCCPCCKSLLDGASQISGDEQIAPKEGDYTVCIKCGAFLRFGETLDIIELTPEDFERLLEEDSETVITMLKARAAIMLLNKLKAERS